MIEKIWVGKYESELNDMNNLFAKCITVYGSSKSSNYSFCEQGRGYSRVEFCKFAYKIIKSIVLQNPDAKFYFYNELWAFEIITYDTSLKHNFVLLNDKELLDFLSNKALARTWLSKAINIPPFIMISKDECDLEYLMNSFPGKRSFIIQGNVSSGGKVTLAMDKDTVEHVKSHLNEPSIYLAAPYLKNSISLNATILINSRRTVIFPISQQIFDLSSIHLRYTGADFISGLQIYKQFRGKIDSFLDHIALQLKASNYQGIIGVDFLIYNDNLFFIEFNPRFQGSTFLINRALNEKYNITIYDLLLDTYENEVDLEAINLSFSHKLTDIQPFETFIDGDVKRLLFDMSIADSGYTHSCDDYYDYFAEKYYLILSDYEKKIKTQGKILENIIKAYSRIETKSILDCTCGIGVQAVSLANLGYNVVGSDISLGEIEFARKEAIKRSLSIEYHQADCTALENTFSQTFDAIISIDSALTHLMNEDNFLRALKSIFGRLNEGGVFLASFRDYDKLIHDKPDWAYEPRVKKVGEKAVIALRNFEWNEDIITSHQYLIENEHGKTQLFYNTYQQWAITRDKALQIAQHLPYRECFWLLPEKSGFSQQLLCLIK